MITVVIPYTGNKVGLATLLVQLQPQLHTDDDIYIVDSTPERSGVEIARLYGSTRCYIFVEVGKYDSYQAIGFGMQNCKENGQKGFLVMSSRLVISQTFIANLKKAIKKGFKVISPTVIETPYHQMPQNFQWYNPSTTEVTHVSTFSPFCYYQDLGNDEMEGWGGLGNETAVVLPYKESENEG